MSKYFSVLLLAGSLIGSSHASDDGIDISYRQSPGCRLEAVFKKKLHADLNAMTTTRGGRESIQRGVVEFAPPSEWQQVGGEKYRGWNNQESWKVERNPSAERARQIEEQVKGGQGNLNIEFLGSGEGLFDVYFSKWNGSHGKGSYYVIIKTFRHNPPATSSSSAQ
jgi:hypothetical protein